MINSTNGSCGPCTTTGIPIQSLRFISSADNKYIGLYAQNQCKEWVPLNVGLTSMPSLQQVRDVDRNISMNTGSYTDAHFYLRSAEGNNITTAFYTNKDGGGIQSGNSAGAYVSLNLQPLGGLLNYGGNEVATKVWTQGQGYLKTETDPVYTAAVPNILMVKTTIPTGANLNTYQTTGVYLQPSNANAAAGTNYPIGLAGKLEVVFASSSMMWQTYHVYADGTLSNRAIWRREYYSGNWSPWVKLIDTISAAAYELLANKATSFTTVNNTLYPTTQAANNLAYNNNQNSRIALSNNPDITKFDTSPIVGNGISDILAFKVPIVSEASTDWGATWSTVANTTYTGITSQRTKYAVGTGQIALVNTAGSTNSVRLTYIGVNNMFPSWVKYVSGYTTTSVNFTLTLETSSDNATYIVAGTYTALTQSIGGCWFKIQNVLPNGNNYVRITITADSAGTAAAQHLISQIQLLTYRQDYQYGVEANYPFVWSNEKYLTISTPTTTASTGYDMALLNTSGQLTRGSFANMLSTNAIQNQTVAIQTANYRINGFGQASRFYVGTGTGPGANTLFVSDANLTGGSSSYGMRISSVVQSDVTTSASVFSSNIGTQATSFTTNITHYLAQQGIIGSGSTVTTQIGYQAANSMIGATNNYGFWGQLPTGTNNWNLYMMGTAPNYLNGRLGLGVTTLTNVTLRNNLAITGGSSSYGTYTEGEVQSDVSSAYVYGSVPRTAATAFTLSSLVHYYASQGTIGSGSSITSQYGFFVNASLVGAANNYGFISSLPTGSSNNNWNLYMNGTAPNYLAGRLGLNTTNLTNVAFRNAITLTGSATQTANYSENTINSDVTSLASIYISTPNIQAATFTLATLNHYSAQQGTYGTGATITTQQGFVVTASMISAGTNIGFRGAIPSGSNRWNLYMDGTAQNYFAGNVGMGVVSTPLYKLHISAGTVASSTALVSFEQNSGYFRIGSDNPASGVFQPTVYALSNDANTGLAFKSLNSGGNAQGAFYFTAQNASGAALTAGNTFKLRNNTTDQIVVDYTGNITLGILAGTGTRMVVTDSTGKLSAQTIAADTNFANTDLTATGNRFHTFNANSLTFGGTGWSIGGSSTGMFLQSTTGNGLLIAASNGNTNAAQLKTDNLTANRIYQFPNVAGTLALTSDVKNIYNSDGTLTGNRTLTGAGNNLTFSGYGSFLYQVDSTNFVRHDSSSGFVINKTNLFGSNYLIFNNNGLSTNTTSNTGSASYQMFGTNFYAQIQSGTNSSSLNFSDANLNFSVNTAGLISMDSNTGGLGIKSQGIGSTVTLSSPNGVLINSQGTYAVTLSTSLLTAARTASFPDKTGTLAMTSDILNVYNSNGTLTGNRTINGGNFSFSVTGADTMKVQTNNEITLNAQGAALYLFNGNNEGVYINSNYNVGGGSAILHTTDLTVDNDYKFQNKQGYLGMYNDDIASGSYASGTLTLTRVGGTTVGITGLAQGTVTNFTAGSLSPLFTTSVATSTTTPTLSFALSAAGANTFFGNNTAASASPSYTPMAALTAANDTNVTISLGGTPATSLFKAVSLTMGWTGTLSVARGGTGVSTLTGIAVGNGTSAFTAITGTASQLLRRNAANTGYEFFTPTYLTAETDPVYTAAIPNIMMYKGLIPSSANLNTYITTGKWYQNSIANALAGSNYPLATAGMLEVVTSGISGDMVFQTYHCYSNGGYYQRSYYNSAWTSWLFYPSLNNVILNQTASAQSASFWITGANAGIGAAPGTLASLLNIGATATDGWPFTSKTVNITGNVGIAGGLNVTGNSQSAAFVDNVMGYSMQSAGAAYMGFYTTASTSSSALVVKVGGLVISNVYSDVAPTNGLFVKGGIQLSKITNTTAAISWYDKSYKAWTTYMANAGSTTNGVNGNITAPTGVIVNQWALRNFIENTSGYGFTWETGANTGNPSAVIAELEAATGNFRVGGHVSSGEWFRSRNSGNGWYNEATNSGIHSVTANEVRVYLGNSFRVGDTGNGYTAMLQGSTTVPGLHGFYNPDGTRNGYIGANTSFDNGIGIMNYVAERGYHRFTLGTSLTGNTVQILATNTNQTELLNVGNATMAANFSVTLANSTAYQSSFVVDSANSWITGTAAGDAGIRFANTYHWGPSNGGNVYMSLNTSNLSIYKPLLISGLSGTGTRMMTVDASGNVSAQAIPGTVLQWQITNGFNYLGPSGSSSGIDTQGGYASRYYEMTGSGVAIPANVEFVSRWNDSNSPWTLQMPNPALFECRVLTIRNGALQPNSYLTLTGYPPVFTADGSTLTTLASMKYTAGVPSWIRVISQKNSSTGNFEWRVCEYGYPLN